MNPQPLERNAGIALPGLKVVEWGRGLAAAYAGKMLADFGAEVVRVRDASCVDPHRESGPALRAFLDAAKAIVTIDPRSSEGRSKLRGLASGADILIEDRAGGEVEELMALNPRLVIVTVTPFGLDGPYAGYRGSDLEVAFLSGLAHLTPRDIAMPESGPVPPPLKMPGSLVSFYAGASVAAAALTGLYARGRSDRGSRVDVSMLDSLIPALRREIALYHFEGQVASRFMRVWRLAPYGVKPCKDGFVFLQVVERYHWEGLVEMMGSPEWARDPRYLEPEYRFEHRRDIEARIAPWLLEQSRQAFAIEAQRRGVPFAPINELADLAQIPQLHHRCFFRRVNGHESAAVVPGMPFRISRAAKPAAGRTQTPAVRDAGTGPLAGLRVIDFGHVWAGPYCAALLADMGAEVIKIESHQRVDIHRRQGPYPERLPGLNRSGVWNTQNRGKRSVSLNLSTPRGRELARDLVAKSDVAIENFAPGVMQRLGLDYAALSEVNPGLVMASLSAFGQDGPQKGYVGYGPSLDAWAGLDRMTAYRHGGPNALGGMFPDTSSAIHGAAAILAALHERERTGKGCHVDVSELEVSILLLGDLVAESLNGTEIQRLGNSDAHHFPHGCYACAGEDAWIAVSVPDAEAWRGLCRLLGRSDWDADKRLATSEGRRALAGAIEGAISAWARDREAGAAMRELQASSVPAAVANTARTLLGDPQLAARGFFQMVEHPETGPQPLYGPIWRFDGQARRIDRHAPLLGADNDYVLGTLLGLAPEAIAALAAEKVVY